MSPPNLDFEYTPLAWTISASEIEKHFEIDKMLS